MMIHKNVICFLGFVLTAFIGNNLKATNISIEPLSEETKQVMRSKKTWKEGCPVGIERLRIVKFPYYDFESKEHDNGEMVVLDAVSQHVAAIFTELYDLKFPLAKARPIEHYDGNDEASMADNNSSCFNCREITGGGLPSLHSYGLAIDINPIQNPYIGPQEGENAEQGLAKVLPGKGLGYLNRTNIRPGMAEMGGIRDIFKKHGFTIWGGQWNNPIDWQHFQPSRATAQILAVMNPNDALTFFEMYVKEPTLFNAIDPKNNQFIGLYLKNSKQFMKLLETEPDLLKATPDEAYLVMEKSINTSL